jgi:hypothetical protein
MSKASVQVLNQIKKIIIAHVQSLSSSIEPDKKIIIAHVQSLSSSIDSIKKSSLLLPIASGQV